MHFFRFVFALLLTLTTAFPAAPARADDFLIGGIQINEDDQDAWSAALVDAGYNTLHVTTYAIQGDWDSDDLHVDPVDEGTIKKIRAARAAGLNVALVLRLHTDHAHERNRFLWHGLVWPRDAATLDRWFAKYRAYILQWSKVAEEEGVTLLGIGSEMNALAATVPVRHPGAGKLLPGSGAAGQGHRRHRRGLAHDSRGVRAGPGRRAPAENLRSFASLKTEHLARWAAAVSFVDAGSDRRRCGPSTPAGPCSCSTGSS